MVETITTYSEEETILLGKKFSSGLKRGDIVALYGDLGTGKTQLIKGICAGLGVGQTVTSPTFTLMNIYDGQEKIFHYDFYRLNSESEIYDLCIDDYFFSDGISLIEWAEKCENLLPPERININLSYGETENSRLINFVRKT